MGWDGMGWDGMLLIRYFLWEFDRVFSVLLRVWAWA